MDVDVLESLLINPVSKKNHFIADCPFCGKANHFYIHKGTNSRGYEHGWDCKKCGKEGNIITLLLFLNKIHLLEGREVNVNQPLQTSLKAISNQAVTLTKEQCEAKTVKLPIGFKLAEEGDKYYDYLRERKFTEIDFELYQAGFTKLGILKNDYVIIPITRDFQYKGFIGRYIGDNKEKKRYINSLHTEFNKLLFGFDELNERTKTVILVEGVFDKVSVTTELNLHFNDEMKCLATFGKKFSEIQVYLLQSRGIENLIFMYDGRDAVSDMKRITGEIRKNFNNVWLTYTGMNDPGESDRDQILGYLSNMEKPNQFWLSKLNKLKLK